MKEEVINISTAELLEELSIESEPTEKAVETLYIFRCLYIKNREWQRFDQPIAWYGDANLDVLVEYCYDRFGSSVRKFELEIKNYYEVDYDSASGKFTWLDYTRSLMLKRCLQIWPRLKLDQIKRGLAVQQSGKHSVNGQIGSLNCQKAIKKESDGTWVVVNPEALKPWRGKLLPQSAIEAAKKRAHEWQLKRRSTSDK
jgi:hypothetical protein